MLPAPVALIRPLPGQQCYADAASVGTGIIGPTGPSFRGTSGPWTRRSARLWVRRWRRGTFLQFRRPARQGSFPTRRNGQLA